MIHLSPGILFFLMSVNIKIAERFSLQKNNVHNAQKHLETIRTRILRERN